MKQIFNK